MSKIKYNPLIDPFQAARQGFTFQTGYPHNQMNKRAGQVHHRTNLQMSRQCFMMSATRAWRNLSAASKLAWNAWTSYFPQHTLKHDDIFLSAYHNFIKRNFYYFYSEGSNFSFMLNPSLVTYAEDSLTITAKITAGRITLSLSFLLNDYTIDYFFFVSSTPFQSHLAKQKNELMLFNCRNVNQDIDITDLFYNQFGYLPVTTDVINFSYVGAGKDNGQFFFRKIMQVTFTIPPSFILGFLYNFYAAKDIRKLSSSDLWVLPYFTHINRLNSEIGGSTQGYKLKETGFVNWNFPNTGATNSLNFYGRGAGRRESGIFNYLNQFLTLIVDYGFGSNFYNWNALSYNSGSTGNYAVVSKSLGSSIRLVKYPTTLAAGEIGSYSGNDGKVYPTICVGSQEFLQYNLKETKFRNGEYVHGFDGGLYTPISNSQWVALTSAGLCAMNDDPSNA